VITTEYCDARSREAWHSHDYDKYRAIDRLVAIHQEQRPKNAGVHTDQNRRHHSRAKRRADRAALKKENQR
jgi:hypothetical protein